MFTAFLVGYYQKELSKIIKERKNIKICCREKKNFLGFLKLENKLYKILNRIY